MLKKWTRPSICYVIIVVLLFDLLSVPDKAWPYGISIFFVLFVAQTAGLDKTLVCFLISVSNKGCETILFAHVVVAYVESISLWCE